MFCTKCGKRVPEELKHCPDCNNELNNRRTPLYRAVTITGVASMVCAVMALHVIIITIGILVGAANIYLFFRFHKETKNSNYLKLPLAFGITGLISNLGWLIYISYFL